MRYVNWEGFASFKTLPDGRHAQLCYSVWKELRDEINYFAIWGGDWEVYYAKYPHLREAW